METTEHGGSLSVGIGNALITFPGAWRVDSKSEDGIVARSANGSEQATISVLSFSRPVSFDVFCLLCQKRVEAEKKGLKDGFIHPDPPTPMQVRDSGCSTLAATRARTGSFRPT